MVRRIAIVACLILGPGTAHADVTEYFGDPGPVDGSFVIPEGVEDDSDPPDVEASAAAEPPEAEPVSEPTSEPIEASEPVVDAPEPTVASEPVVPVAPPVPVSPAIVAASVGAPAPGLPVEPASLGPTPHCAEPVVIERIGDGSHERASLTLLDCDGRVEATSLTELSILARPSGVDRPSDEEIEAHGGEANWVAPSVRRLHPGLVERVRAIADQYPGHVIEIISGYRPDARDGSRHRFGRALDLRVRGVEVAALDTFLQTLPLTGVGLYPTTDFVHVDVRSRPAHWIDTSGPGEPPSLVRPAAEPSSDDAEAPSAEPTGTRARAGSVG